MSFVENFRPFIYNKTNILDYKKYLNIIGNKLENFMKIFQKNL